MPFFPESTRPRHAYLFQPNKTQKWLLPPLELALQLELTDQAMNTGTKLSQEMKRQLHSEWEQQLLEYLPEEIPLGAMDTFSQLYSRQEQMRMEQESVQKSLVSRWVEKAKQVTQMVKDSIPFLAGTGNALQSPILPPEEYREQYREFLRSPVLVLSQVWVKSQLQLDAGFQLPHRYRVQRSSPVTAAGGEVTRTSEDVQAATNTGVQIASPKTASSLPLRYSQHPVAFGATAATLQVACDEGGREETHMEDLGPLAAWAHERGILTAATRPFFEQFERMAPYITPFLIDAQIYVPEFSLRVTNENLRSLLFLGQDFSRTQYIGPPLRVQHMGTKKLLEQWKLAPDCVSPLDWETEADRRSLYKGLWRRKLALGYVLCVNMVLPFTSLPCSIIV